MNSWTVQEEVSHIFIVHRNIDLHRFALEYCKFLNFHGKGATGAGVP